MPTFTTRAKRDPSTRRPKGLHNGILGSKLGRFAKRVGGLHMAPAVQNPARGIIVYRTVMVNCVLVQDTDGGQGNWVLIDTGLPGFASRIANVAKRHFGKGLKPKAIILTHGHFDHAGNVKALSKKWNVPVYAHPLEFPYLDGRSSYAPIDPTADYGMMAQVSRTFPTTPKDISDCLCPLPSDGSVPFLKGWRWLETPGHAPGHVSFFRERDRVLIAGDAVITTRFESTLSQIRQAKVVSPPPAYGTPDWRKAETSVKHLASLEPDLLISGHGQPMEGREMQMQLRQLAANFRTQGVPSHGRYVARPATANLNGLVSVPPPAPDRVPAIAGAALLGALVSAGVVALVRKRRSTARKVRFEATGSYAKRPKPQRALSLAARTLQDFDAHSDAIHGTHRTDGSVHVEEVGHTRAPAFDNRSQHRAAGTAF